MGNTGNKMVMKLVPASQIKRREISFRVNDSDHLKALKQSIISNGQTQNIKVRTLPEPTEIGEVFEIVDGLKTFNILKQLSHKEIWVYDFGEVTDIAALKLYLQHNICHFERDDLKLSEITRQLADVYPPSSIAKFTPFNIDQIKNLIKLLEFNWDGFNEAADFEGRQASLF